LDEKIMYFDETGIKDRPLADRQTRQKRDRMYLKVFFVEIPLIKENQIDTKVELPLIIIEAKGSVNRFLCRQKGRARRLLPQSAGLL